MGVGDGKGAEGVRPFLNSGEKIVQVLREIRAFCQFSRATAYATAIPSVCLSVCLSSVRPSISPSVCHTRGFTREDEYIT